MSILSEDGHKILVQQLMQDEGYRRFAYKDTMGFRTVGIGRNLDTVGISLDEAYYLLNNDIAITEEKLLKIFGVYETLSDNRKMVLINMGFNMGIGKLTQFVQMMKALDKSDFEKAAQEMLDSHWAKEVPVRAARLGVLMRKG